VAAVADSSASLLAEWPSFTRAVNVFADAFCSLLVFRIRLPQDAGIWLPPSNSIAGHFCLDPRSDSTAWQLKRKFQMVISPSTGKALSKPARDLADALSPQQKKTVRRLQEELHASSPAALSVWHELGRLAHVLASDGMASLGRNRVLALAELIGCSPAYVYQARKFARLYSTSDVAELEGKLSWSQLCRLVCIADEQQRRSLERACAAEKWTVRRLEREVRGRFGRQRRWGHGGRRSHRPQNLIEALGDLDRHLTGIVRWYRSLEHQVPEATPESTRRGSRSASRKAFDIEGIPPVLRRRIADAIDELEELRQAVQGAMEMVVGE